MINVVERYKEALEHDDSIGFVHLVKIAEAKDTAFGVQRSFVRNTEDGVLHESFEICYPCFAEVVFIGDIFVGRRRVLCRGVGVEDCGLLDVG